MHEQSCQVDSVVSCVDKENKITNSLCESTDKNKHLKNIKLCENKKETKSSKMTSVLDLYCNPLNESADFIECELSNKVKNASQKDVKKEFPSISQVSEVMMCEICKEDITSLDVHNRGIHVNNCIDKQMSSAPEITTSLSTNEDAFILECPLCFKHFAFPEQRSNHIKKCGRSKGLSLQSILKALELQERHVLERISLGLPTKPVKSVKMPKNSVSKKAIVQPKNKNQSDIQLAKALSLSLKSSTQHDDIEATQTITPVILKPPSANQKPGKKTKKIISSTPLLVLRSDEDRKKLLLENVASILTLAIEHSSSADNETNVEVDAEKEKTGDQKDFTLWYLSSKSSDKCHYYVEELLDWIKPSDVEMGDKLFHLSQIPGHEIVTQLPCEYKFDTTQENNDTDCSNSEALPITAQQPLSVIESLSSLVASSWMSDVDIHTACGSVIPAHKLILAVRCPTLKQDSDFCLGKGRASLKWDTVSFDAALQFLNFIYTGNIDVKKDMMSDLFHLANKYEVLDLQIVLNARNDDTKSEIIASQEVLTIEKESSVPSSPCHVSTYEAIENAVCESQEAMNMDLEIVYNCINSSLKPSQPVGTQSAISSDTDSFKCTQVPETKDDCIIECKTDDDEYVSHSDGSVKTVACNSFSPKFNGSDSTSPVLFDANDSENDAEDLSDNVDSESTVCMENGSEKFVSRSPDVSTELLDVNFIESDSSNDSVKFLQSSYICHNNAYNSPEKTPKSISFSPIRNSQDSSYQYKHDKKMTPTKISEHDITECAEVKSSFLSSSQVPDEKKYDLILNECNESHVDLCAEIRSPSTSYSQGLLSGFRSVCKDEILDIADGKDDRKSSDRDLLHHENLINKSSNIINSVKNECATNTYLVTPESDNKGALNFSFESSSSKININELPAINSDYNAIKMSPVKNPASPEILICDSDSDSNSHQNVPCKTELQHNYHVNFSEKVMKSNNNSSADSSTSSGKSLHGVLSDPVDDAVFESYDYFNHDSFSNGDYLHALNSSEHANEKETFHNENNKQPVKSSISIVKKGLVPVLDCLQSPKISTYSSETPTNKTVTPSSKSEFQKPQFQLSDSPVTPFPDYKQMMTPEIKQALRRIGVKPLPRKKAVAILSHVYNETHPLIDVKTNSEISSEASEILLTNANKVNKPKKRKQTTQDSEKPIKKQQRAKDTTKEAILASPESDDSNPEKPEWLGCVPEMSFSQSNHESPTKPSKDDIESIKIYIQSNEDLYHNVLNYIPLNLVEFHQELKKNDIKISIQKLMDFLDEQCITFTCPRKEEYKKKQTARANRFRKNMIAKLSQQAS